MDPAFCNQTTDRFRLLMVPSGPFLPFAWNRSLRSQINALVSSLPSGKIRGQSPWSRLNLLQRLGGSLHFHEDTGRSLAGHGIVPVFQKLHHFPAFPEFHIFHFFPISPVLSSRGSHIWQCSCSRVHTNDFCSNKLP